MWNAILEEVREEEGKDDSELVWFEAESGDEGLRIIVADKEPSSWLLLEDVSTSGSRRPRLTLRVDEAAAAEVTDDRIKGRFMEWVVLAKGTN